MSFACFLLGSSHISHFSCNIFVLRILGIISLEAGTRSILKLNCIREATKKIWFTFLAQIHCFKPFLMGQNFHICLCLWLLTTSQTKTFREGLASILFNRLLLSARYVHVPCYYPSASLPIQAVPVHQHYLHHPHLSPLFVKFLCWDCRRCLWCCARSSLPPCQLSSPSSYSLVSLTHIDTISTVGIAI